MSSGLLLDTCAVLWMATKKQMSPGAIDAFKSVSRDGRPLCVSAISAWEIGMLIARGKIPTTKDPLPWFEEFVSAGQITVHLATPGIFIAACYLPSLTHKDPIDRILIATAREHDLTLVTRDRAILAYGTAGHVKTLAC